MPLQHFKCFCSRSGEMPLLLSLAGKKMQQCSLEAEGVKKWLALPGSVLHRDLAALCGCLFPPSTAISGRFWPLVL